MHIKFVKTQYHSGRLQITFTPGALAAVAPTTINSLYSLRTIIDVREQDTVNLNLPFITNYDYLNTASLYPYTSGLLDVRVLTDLKAPETCSSTIYAVVTYTPGEDFEFAGPTFNQYHNGPFLPQSSGGTGVLIATGVADGVVKQTELVKSKKCTGELFTSVKQILNRVMPLNNSAVGDLVATASVDIDPYFVGSMSNNAAGTVSYGQTFNDGYSMIAHMYAYFRGGMKVALAHSGNAFTTSLYCANGTMSTAFSTAGANYANVYPATSRAYNSAIMPYGGTYVHDHATALSYVQVPYINSTPVAMVARYFGVARNVATGAVLNYPRARLSVSAIGLTTATSGALIGRGCLDDFQFTCFLGCPPALISVV